MVRYFPFDLRLSDLPHTLRSTLSFGISHGLAVIYARADITIVAYYLGSVAAGVYSPASTLMATLFLVPTVVYEVMLPVFSKLYVKNESLIPKRSFQLVLLSMGLGIVLGIGLVIIAYPLVWVLYSPEFIASVPVLIILSNVLLFKCISFALAGILAAVGWQAKRIWVQLIAGILNIGLNLLFVRSAGIIGVAYIYVFTEFLLTAGYILLLLLWQRDHLMLSIWRPIL
jgi:O-antigen/teichoic acid export membrane protein